MSLSDQLTDILNSLGGFGPELWLSVAFCGLLLAELLLLRTNVGVRRRWLAGLSIGSLIVAGLWAAALPTRGFLFTHLLFVDNQAIYFQLIIALSAVLVLACGELSAATAILLLKTSTSR